MIRYKTRQAVVPCGWPFTGGNYDWLFVTHSRAILRVALCNPFKGRSGSRSLWSITEEGWEWFYVAR